MVRDKELVVQALAIPNVYQGLFQALPEAFRREVVSEVLENRQNFSQEFRKSIDSQLNAVPRHIKGARKNSTAPLIFLVPFCVDLTGRPEAPANTLCMTFLQAWSSLRAEIVEEVADALHSLGINVPHGSPFPEYVQHFVSESDFEQLLVRVRSNFSHQLGENELRLLVILGMSAVPIPDDDYHTLCQEQPDEIVMLTQYVPEVWKDTLQSLEALPAESSAWDQVESLVAEVRKLAALKVAQRDMQRRQLREAIERLQSREDLSYFQAECALSWRAEHIDQAEAGSLAQDVDRLFVNMDAYLALEEEKPDTIGAKHELEARERALEQEIVTCRDHLNGWLSPPAEDQTPPDETTEYHLTEQDLMDESAEAADETNVVSEAPELENEAVSWSESEEPVASPPYLQQEEQFLEDVGLDTVEETVSGPGELLDEPDGSGLDTVIVEQPEIEAFDESEVELRSVTDAAQVWRLEQSPDSAEAFFWATLAHGDWSGAYWLARAMHERFGQSPLAPELLAAMVGASVATPNSAQLMLELASLINHYDTEALRWPGSLLALGAALRGTLVAPEAGFTLWLECPSAIPSLYGIVNALRVFSDYRIVLRPSLLHGVASEDERRSRIAEAARRMQDSMERAPRQTMSYQPATAIWREMVARKSPLYELMQLVSENKANNAQHVSQILNEWSDKNFIEDRIDFIRGKKRPRIVASARQEIIRSAQEICGLARSWQQLTEQEERIAREGKWLFQQVATLRTQVQNSIGLVSHELKELTGPETPAAPRACVLAFTQQFCDFLRTLELPTHAFECQSAPPWHMFMPNSSAEGDLRTVLLQRLYWLPELTPEHVYSGADAPELPKVIDALSQVWADKRDTPEVLDLWLKKKDFRYVEYLLEALPEQDFESAQREYQEARDDACEELAQQLEQLREEIEQAVVDGLIVDDLRAAYLGQLDSIAPYDTDEFPSKFARLGEIRADIEDARQYRLDTLARTWDGERKRQFPLVGPDRWTHVEQRVHEAFERRDSRAIEEYLDHISGVGQMDEQQFQDIFSDTTSTHNLLDEFLQKLDTVERELEHNRGLEALERAIRSGKRFADYHLNNLSRPRQRGVLSALEAWQRLKGTDGRIADGQLFQYLADLLNFLQYQLDSQTASYPFNIMQRKNDSILVQSRMTVSEALVRPVPQFGSMTGGQFDLLCVWERPSADTLGALLYDLRSESRSTIVLYFGRITRQRRQQIARDRNKHLPVVILDETLLAFVALKSMIQNPLPVFLQCALPYTGISPYTPGQAGNVPPEIFFGREEMVRQLQGLETCIVFGGRQLGKSALLRNVQSRFHNPKSEQYAWVKDIKNVGDPAHRIDTDTLWPMLRDGFKEMGLWGRGRARAEREDDIVNHIRQVVLENPSRRVIVLLDEADNFLETDASENFRIVDSLRVLMVDTQRRFKVVFAGLHNVQRFKNVPNQPLAHFGKALCVGPLEPTEALKLVRQPLEVMGFHIDNSTALRILSHTNYHPGLIQLFCDELLKWLYRNPRVQIPYKIKREDVDAVYLRQNVRDGIRQRFEWTLALDPKYQIVAWSLIEDQTLDRDSYSRQYRSSEILRIARSWWQEGFEQVEIKSLLDEMVGLGVLIESEGLYRLRSPNLVRLMGEANVEQGLLQVADFAPSQRRLDPDHHHALLNVQQDLYSPLTIAQEHLLNKDDTGVGLLFSSTIAGSERINDVLRYFLPTGTPESEGVCQELRPRLGAGTQLVDEIQRVSKQYSTAKHLILCYRFQADVREQQLTDQVEKAAEFLKDDGVHLKHRIRVIYLLDSRAAWTWMQIDPQYREALEQRVDAVVSIAPWSRPGIRRWMEHREMITTEDTLRHVYDATGGWHSLLEDLFKVCGSKSGVDPRDQAVKLTEQFEVANFRQAIWDRLDLKGLPVAEIILRFLCQENGPQNAGVPAGLVTPSLIDKPLVNSDDDCRRALALLERLRYISLDSDEDQLIRVNPVILRTAL